MGISSKFFWSYLCFLLVSASANQEIITGEIGKSVTLPCRTPTNNILIVEWTNPELVPDYVLLYRDEQIDPEQQHSSFENRVDLKDRQMKDGDLSVILKNVTINDTGTYNCYVFSRGVNREKRAIFDLKPTNSVYLRAVVPPGHTGGDTEDGSVGLTGGHRRGHFPLIASLSFICVVCILTTVKYFCPTRDKATDMQLA
ncbi:V-set domain-containing T-cell activation inhibitor 1 [Haplochromis burtoni]|uniref:V-set domain-containing T-cell activation inhibitor 1 n=1 Tax=Haplochromis burtoni TaxID=8153 RepID=UPI0003BC6A48|nr:V-set domain-containing T-cell activation inhibitor 1 [Haplochromis burtoni]